MESSFKKAYDRTVNTDGSIDLKFTAQKIGAHSGAGFAGILVLAMLPVSCAVTLPVMYALTDQRSMRNGFPTGPVIMWNIVAVALWIFIVRKYNFRKSKLTIKPGEGLLFAEKQLPFKDIQSIGTSHETTGRNPKGNAYIYAQSHGKEIPLTGYVTKELADALASEITNAPGIA